MPVAATSPDANSNILVAGADTYPASGAITTKNGAAFLTKAGVGVMTLALPIAGTDDGKRLLIMSTTAQAHTVTTPANGYNGATHIATFAANIGSELELVAYQGSWWMSNNIGITLS